MESVKLLSIIRDPGRYAGRSVLVHGILRPREPVWIFEDEYCERPDHERGLILRVPALRWFLLGPFQPVGVPLPNVIGEVVGRVDAAPFGGAVASLDQVSRVRVREERLPPPVGGFNEFGYGFAADGSRTWDQKGRDEWREVDLAAVAEDAAAQEAAFANEPKLTHPIKLTDEEWRKIGADDGTTYFEI